MPTKALGRAHYKAYRLLGMVHLTASGDLPNFNDKPDFEQLPFLIFPPMWAFYVTSQDISLPAVRPFVYEETIAYPKSATSIRVQDADGFHDVPIAEVVVPDFDVGTVSAAGASFCVFHGPGINPMMVAPCDAKLPSAWQRVFGPDTQTNCETFAKQNGGLGGGSALSIVPENFKAWMDSQPPGPNKLIVRGTIDVPTGGWQASLKRAVPQGFNPMILILDLATIAPTGNVTQAFTTIEVRFEETPPAQPYTDVHIRGSGADFTIPVEQVS